MALRNAVRTGWRWLIAITLTAVLSPFIIRLSAALIFRDETHTVESTPEKPVAIIFGARVYPSGRLSAMLADRVATGADLYFAGKVDKLLMTGASQDIDEPGAMRSYALRLGVPGEDIIVDHGGLRTYDSCYRARYIFGVEDAILVTQNFHLDRALMTCNVLGIRSVGVFADYQRPRGYSRVSLSYSRTREFPAITVAVLDLIRREPPTILGEPTPIFEKGSPAHTDG